MKRLSALLLAFACIASLQADPLASRNRASIDASGTYRGNFALNQAAGDAQQQSNVRVDAVGSAALVGSDQRQHLQLDASQPIAASASISGAALRGSGILGVNQGAGLGNQQINAFRLSLSNGPESLDDSVLAQSVALTKVSGSATPVPGGAQRLDGRSRLRREQRRGAGEPERWGGQSVDEHPQRQGHGMTLPSQHKPNTKHRNARRNAMKATMVLTPLALAMAAVLSVSAYAGNEGGWHPPKPNPQSNNKGGATALVVDTQQNYNNKVSNFGTLNNASVSGSIKDASGNVGVNVAAGDNNQQANAAALASADASFVFGTATASTSVLQSGYGNTLNNYSNPNTASLSNSANNVSGNLGVNVAAGNFNQQKNDLAAAVSNGQYSTAGSAASQTSTGNTTVNSANYAYGGTYVSLKLNADGSYKGTSDQIGDVYLDTWEGQTHPGGSNTGHIDVDSQAQGAKDLNHDGGAFAFKEKGDVDLKGTVSGFIPAIVGFKTPVTNNASLSNSLQNVSGNVGVNIAAGGGNQQSNSLSIAAGCSSCPAGGESLGF